MNPTDKLALDLDRAKEAEDEARAKRIRAEEALIAALGCKEEGAQTHKTDWYGVTITGKLTRTINPDADIPMDVLNRIVRIKSELDVGALRRLAVEDPEVYRVAANAIITKPAKPSVSIKRLVQTEAA